MRMAPIETRSLIWGGGGGWWWCGFETESLSSTHSIGQSSFSDLSKGSEYVALFRNEGGREGVNGMGLSPT